MMAIRAKHSGNIRAHVDRMFLLKCAVDITLKCT